MTLDIGAQRRGGPLRALLGQAGWSGADLARAVNRLGAEAGLSLRYGRASAAQWAAGTIPRPPVATLIAEALTRRLGRRVTPSQALPGLAGQPSDRHPQWQDIDSATRLRWLAEANHRGAAGNRVFRRADLSAPDWQTAVSITGEPARSRSPRAGSSEVESAATALRVYSEVDVSCGGGLVRAAAFEYLSGALRGWLRSSAGGDVHTRLLSVAAQWTYFCGFLCFDDELHGLAQRCYQTALRLAADARDAGCYATTLRAMSVHSCKLGHPHEALRLAQAAVAADPGAEAGATAFLYGQLAVALAATGDRFRAVAELRRAERQLERAGSPARPLGRYHRAALAHQRAAMCCWLGDRAGAIAALTDSISGRDAAERRAHAITQAWLAELLLDQGHLDEALARWHDLCDLYLSLHSGRVCSALVELRARLRPHRQYPSAARLLSRASQLQLGRYG